LYLPGNAVRALDALGLGSALTAAANPIRRQRFLTHTGDVLADLDVEHIWSEVGSCCALGRGTLHQILEEWTLETAQMGRSLTGLTTGTFPEVTFSDGSTERYDLVIGADGVNSTIRRLVFDGSARPVGQTAWRFLASDHPEIADWTVALARGRAFLTVSLGGGQVYCYADADAEHDVDEGDDWRTLFDDFAEPVPTLLRQGARAHRAAIEEVALADWTRPGVVLVGDAAHASSPNMAQGVAMAIEDALVLAETLSASDDVATSLSLFMDRRRPRVSWVQKQTHRRDRTRSLPSLIRNATLRIAAERIYRSNYRPLLEPG
jgi:2-polyprenyl-6-methoxyphenol hydroxylase-like FAD-dependent oxidoreductase